MKNIIISIVACIFSLASLYASANPIEKRGVLFFSTSGDWSRASVIIDGDQEGSIIDGFSVIVLKPGKYTLNTLSRYGGYQGKTRSWVTLDIAFEVEAGKVTSLGNLVFLKEGGKSYVFPVHNDRAAKVYLQQYRSNIYQNLSGDWLVRADLEYRNEIADTLRSALMKGSSYSTRNAKDFVVADMGILLDIRDPQNIKKIDTGGYEKIRKFLSVREDKETLFTNNLQELYQIADGTLSPIKVPDNHRPKIGFYSENLIVMDDYHGNLSISKDMGETWDTVMTGLAVQHIDTVMSEAGDSVVFGPVTTDKYNKYKKLQGYIINAETADLQPIKWLKHVTKDSNFFFVNDELFLDPVTLDGNKTFLFKYNTKKKKWSEIKPPNRHCTIDSSQTKIFLNCRRGDNYVSSDSGKTWDKVQK